MATLTTCTFLDLVQAISNCATSEAEVVAMVAYLVNSGKVLLCGNFAGARIDPSVPACVVSPSLTAPPWTRFSALQAPP